jgi:F-type H+-transporting ATPase subunit delta
MKITPKQYAIALYESTKSVGMDELGRRVKNFVRILKKNNDLSSADNIIKQYSQYYREKKNISKIEITTPDKLSQEELNSILKKVSKQIEVEEKVDKSLIGGIIIKIDNNTLIDGSVKRKLEDLKKNIS